MIYYISRVQFETYNINELCLTLSAELFAVFQSVHVMNQQQEMKA